MSCAELNPEDWRLLSILLAEDIRRDRDRGLHFMPNRHEAIWRKIQPFCEWNNDDGES